MGCAVFLLGAYWASGIGLLRWIGLVVALGGVLLVYIGFQRARFDAGHGGPGVVKVDERQIIYFGPLSGGTVDLDDISMLSLDPTSYPAVWVLAQPQQAEVHIPVNAEDAEDLFDAFATLPGLRTEYMLSQLRSAVHPVVIWQKHSTRLH